MLRNVSFTLTGRQHTALFHHLYPGDGKEAVAILVCGRRAGVARERVLVCEIVLIPHDACSVRTSHRVTWPSELLAGVLARAVGRGHAIVKIHSHPSAFTQFSSLDDAADRALFQSIHGWYNEDLPHGSAIMLPDGSIFGRTVAATGETVPWTLAAAIGNDLRFWFAERAHEDLPGFARSHAQAFGEGTFWLLRQLSVAVIGCSGTGSPVIEQLARYGVGRLVLIDPDVVEDRNLNRILNATERDAAGLVPKVEVMRRTIAEMGTGTAVVPLQMELGDPRAARAVADCDIVIGCVDTAVGRHLANRLATFYLLPYLDLGVRLDADGKGGVDQVCGAVHYVQPDGSSLLDRRAYATAMLEAESLKKTDAAEYDRRVKEGYVKNAEVRRPAVVSVNMLVAALAVNELLARLHPYRDEPNATYATWRFSLSQGLFLHEPEGDASGAWRRHVGRGDVRPLLDMPELSDDA